MKSLLLPPLPAYSAESLLTRNTTTRIPVLGQYISVLIPGTITGNLRRLVVYCVDMKMIVAVTVCEKKKYAKPSHFI